MSFYQLETKKNIFLLISYPPPPTPMIVRKLLRKLQSILMFALGSSVLNKNNIETNVP